MTETIIIHFGILKECMTNISYKSGPFDNLTTNMSIPKVTNGFIKRIQNANCIITNNDTLITLLSKYNISFDDKDMFYIESYFPNPKESYETLFQKKVLPFTTIYKSLYEFIKNPIKEEEQIMKKTLHLMDVIKNLTATTNNLQTKIKTLTNNNGELDDKYKQLQTSHKELNLTNTKLNTDILKYKKLYITTNKTLEYFKSEEYNLCGICVICYDNKTNVLFDPCNHHVICENCSDKVDECPICRKDIFTKIVTFS
jgi:hypothetical protein